MARSLWSGSITFGLVTIPVRLATAVRDRSLHLHLLTPDGACRLRRKLYCPETGKEYDFQNTARGFEIGPDEYVLLEQDELDRLKPESGKTIDIQEFVELSQIDPVYFDRPYCLVPDPQGARAYDLLVRAMNESGRAGIAKFTMRNKEYLAALRPRDDILYLEVMRFADEVLAPGEIERPESPAKPGTRELEMAKRLIESLEGDFRPEKYHDEYRRKVEAFVEKKVSGRRVRPDSREAPRKGQIVDLMEALKASLNEQGKPRRRKVPGSKSKTSQFSPAKSSRKRPAKRRAGGAS